MHLGIDKTSTWAFSSHWVLHFLPILGKNFLMGLGRKHLSPTIFFPSPFPTKHHLKSFSSSFSLIFFSILPKIHSTKHTLRVCLFGGILGRMKNLGEKGGENEVLVSVWLEGREKKNGVRPGCFLLGTTKIFSP